jgi:hypothetical protein
MQLKKHQKHNIYLSSGDGNSTRMVDEELLIIPKICLIPNNKMVRD